MRRLSLEYGAIDLRMTPQGEYMFFEVNPAGQFLFVERACQLPISEVLARHLATAISDNDCAQHLNEARAKLFKSFSNRSKSAA